LDIAAGGHAARIPSTDTCVCTAAAPHSSRDPGRSHTCADLSLEASAAHIMIMIIIINHNQSSSQRFNHQNNTSA